MGPLQSIVSNHFNSIRKHRIEYYNTRTNRKRTGPSPCLFSMPLDDLFLTLGHHAVQKKTVVRTKKKRYACGDIQFSIWSNSSLIAKWLKWNVNNYQQLCNIRYDGLIKQRSSSILRLSSQSWTWFFAEEFARIKVETFWFRVSVYINDITNKKLYSFKYQ